MKADYSDTLELQRKLTESADAIQAMSHDVAMAKQVREYDGDRRKRCLAVAALPFLRAGNSSAAAETEARASQAYADAMKALGNQLVEADKILANLEALKIQFEVARSLLSLQKAAISHL